ncbi:MAG: polysaccharide deacetylase family protein, partial [Campylobacterales bacterium]|nr:polysaccharide deacetylase family protein [Campylobacterales bacterium]
LAFSSKYLIDASNLDPAKRLSYKQAQAHENYLQGTFCTLAELKEMVDSGHVMVASHGHTHTNLLSKEVDLDVEIRQSRHLLEKALGVGIACFVFPFGKYDERILRESQQHYRYVFRIGNAIHKDFSGIKGVNYRVNGDGLKHPKEIFSPLNLARFWLKGILKRLIA